MIDGKRVLALITARGGSKGLARKNIAPLGGRPMIAWTIAAARESRSVDRTILSSDDDEIIAVARAWGCAVPFVRPADLARDDTPSEPVVLHALDTLPESFDIVVLLQPTSPLRSADDIDQCLARLCEADAPCCVTVTQPAKSPYWMYTMEGCGRLAPLLADSAVTTRRQGLPSVYVLNGAMYAALVPWFRERRTFLAEETVGHVMPPERSVDVDTELDLALAKSILSETLG